MADPMRGEHLEGCRIGGTHAAPCRDINAVPIVPLKKCPHCELPGQTAMHIEGCNGWREDDDQPLTPDEERAAHEYFVATQTPPEPELEDINAYTQYAWDCPGCGNVNTVEHDPAGETVTCDVCDTPARVAETR